MYLYATVSWKRQDLADKDSNTLLLNSCLLTLTAPYKTCQKRLSNFFYIHINLPQCFFSSSTLLAIRAPFQTKRLCTGGDIYYRSSLYSGGLMCQEVFGNIFLLHKTYFDNRHFMIYFKWTHKHIIDMNLFCFFRKRYSYIRICMLIIYTLFDVY